jgi:hypothetical protein
MAAEEMLPLFFSLSLWINDSFIELLNLPLMMSKICTGCAFPGANPPYDF